MVTKKLKSKPKAKPAAKKKASDTPALFRLNVEVGDIDKAAAFYEALFAAPARRNPGARLYLDCGPVTLQIVDVSQSGKPHPAAKALYFTVKDLDTVHARAKKLGCLSRDRVHGVVAGDITVRPWGERSFYADDPWGNPLCFVEAGTVYPG
jgi:predicted enzyme related to lactoylglutathione lyase